MSRLRKLTAIVLLALWLPATTYCAAVTAGFVETSSCCDDGSANHCTADNCDELENNLFHSADSDLVKAPLLACSCLLCAAESVAAVDEVISDRPVPVDWSADWLPDWNFKHRTALPARAPSVI